jgi:hypothetical protein
MNACPISLAAVEESRRSPGELSCSRGLDEHALPKDVSTNILFGKGVLTNTPPESINWQFVVGVGGFGDDAWPKHA